MRARTLLFAFLTSLCLGLAGASDLPTFVNLGFSPDSRNFMFGMYYVRSTDKLPVAEAYLVDVKANRFLPGGQLLLAGERPITLGQDGSGALYNILHTIKPQIDAFKIDHLQLGRLIYIALNGEAQEKDKPIGFQDFVTGTSYELNLIQSTRPVADKAGKPAGIESEFSIDLNLQPKDGKPTKLKLGKPGFFRPQVERYVIRQVLLSPDESNLVVVVERILTGAALHADYMVETISLR